VKPLPFQTDAEVTAAIPRVVQHLERGGLLAYPTETVYGLGSRAVQANVAALAAMKGRVATKPFLLLISDRSMSEAHGLAFNASADALARAFWPGPLTLVLPGGSGRLPDLLRGPDGGIAVRWTSHHAIAQLVAALGAPLTSTSANIPGQAPGAGADAISRRLSTPDNCWCSTAASWGTARHRPWLIAPGRGHRSCAKVY